MTQLCSAMTDHHWLSKLQSIRARLQSGEFTSELQFLDCSFSLPVNKSGRALPPALASCFASSEKRLLHSVSGAVRAGHVLAIMGPSGAGKTTLLNLLTLECKHGHASSRVTLNGQPFTMSLYTQHCATVKQTDMLWAYLTTREHLLMAVELNQPHLSASDKAQVVTMLLEATGLMTAQDTRAGNALMRGLSGGEKRRLSIALALTKQPSVIFLDEPTSGLDSAAAAAVMKYLKQMAVTAHTAIVCVIHQPSSSVFDGFDQTLILADGRVAYDGAASELRSYLQAIGRPVPNNANPA
eukprot:CAMPEP_0119349918 /NCGR_PEP_ID=MMETSP1333-20130426/109794_1 /TAXON_ID=418940 /ORGANISM="Scyphosphaera apsteinii, Strain RCC1455" /LENGTH=296 /DNA_ID=CAMNT_0007362523 /DNA_START=617 /DNA_END=1503 /DNA_ORIENTATION=-